MFKTITTRFPATCRRCGQSIPTGTKVRWAKNAGTYHLSKNCPSTQAAPVCSAPSRYSRPVENDNGSDFTGHLAGPDVDVAAQADRFACGDPSDCGGDYYDREAAHDFFGDDR